jgi:uncharacterized protein (DUF433 family)
LCTDVHKEDQMPGRARGIRIPVELESDIEREAEERGKSWSATTAELLTEAVRMRRVPGVAFTDGPSGRRAVLAGTGHDVWEVVASWKAEGESYPLLRENYPWLTDMQLRSAIAYYRSYPREIDSRLERERRWTPERVREEMPFLDPPGAEG